MKRKDYFEGTEQSHTWISSITGVCHDELLGEIGEYFRNDNRFFRAPRTMNEKRAWADSYEQGVKPRGKRSASNLPDTWDDLYNSRYRVRSWKDSHRCRKQWMKRL